MTSEELKLVLGAYGAAISAGVGVYVMLSNRITRLETVISCFSKKAAEILHSPHTPELDLLLEKYKAREYELSYSEWDRLRVLCGGIASDPENTKGERTLAAWVETIAIHKITPLYDST